MIIEVRQSDVLGAIGGAAIGVAGFAVFLVIGMLAGKIFFVDSGYDVLRPYVVQLLFLPASLICAAIVVPRLQGVLGIGFTVILSAFAGIVAIGVLLLLALIVLIIPEVVYLYIFGNLGWIGALYGVFASRYKGKA